MKILFADQDDTDNAGRKAEHGRSLKILAAAIVGAFLLVLLYAVARPQHALDTLSTLEAEWGGNAFTYDQSLADKWSIAIGSFFRSQLSEIPDIPELVIDVPFDEMRRIYQKRDEAIATGHLVQGPDDFVNASIRLGDRVVRVRLRLKGDWTDHLLGRKWSFRVRVRDGEHLLGMRRFSIQHPLTRGFQSELMYFELLRGLGVMTPRYTFVDVTLNGEAVGLMALEEFFAKELLEFNRRREGVIVRFDESLPWAARDSLSGEVVGWNGAFDDYRNAAIDGIGSTRIQESPALTEQYRVAQGLLRGFADGKLAASDVFDVGQLGRFIAASDALGAWHATRWANLRFYLNPVTLKLEPIPFDATLQDGYTDDRSIVNGEPILLDMLRDPVVWNEYLQAMQLLSMLARDGTLHDNLGTVETTWLDLLRTEFRMLGEYDLSWLAPRVDAIFANMNAVPESEIANLAYNMPFETQLYPVLAHFELHRTVRGLRIQVENAIPRNVTVLAVDWVNDATGERQPASDESLPFGVPPRGLGAAGLRLQIPVSGPPDGEGWELETVSKIEGRSWVSATRPLVAQPAFERPPLPAATIDAVLATHEFLSIDGATLRVEAGDWSVSEHLVVPTGYELHIPAGTTLRFGPDAALVAYGAVRAEGAETAPVILVPSSDSWPGLVVLDAKSRSLLSHVVISRTHSVVLPAWTLTGGVNFYASAVDISSVRFENSRGEDALNIINSEFTIRDSVFASTASDAFDADFSSGEITGSRFENIGSAGGGDAIDISGSFISVSNVQFSRVSDKALSIGERSEMNASNVRVDGAGTGAAAKDGSTLRIGDSQIWNTGFAAMTAYIKKPEYGPARMIAERIDVRGAATPVIVQTHSEVLVDGTAAETQDVDVDALYETVMRPGLRQ